MQISIVCTTCALPKPLDEFHRNKNRKHGHETRCKVCYSEYFQRHYQQNIDRKREDYRRRYEKDPTPMRERMKRYAKAHPEISSRNYRRRLEQLRQAGGSHTKAEWLEVIRTQENRCAHCREIVTLTKDHIIPLSKGGGDYISNIQGLCRPCNTRKGAKI